MIRIKEYEAEFKKMKARKEEEFEYEFEREKKLRTNAMIDEIARLKDEADDREVELDQREEDLVDREVAVRIAEEKIKATPEEMELIIASKQEEVRKELESKHELEIAKLKAEYESKNAILDNKVSTLTESLEIERAAHKDTSAKLETAYGRMEKVATASVEGARTEEAVNRVLSTMNDKK